MIVFLAEIPQPALNTVTVQNAQIHISLPFWMLGKALANFPPDDKRPVNGWTDNAVDEADDPFEGAFLHF